MTATIRRQQGDSQPRSMRFSSLESLGFSDDRSIWSDSPRMETELRRGRHEGSARPRKTVADWKPEDFGKRLTGGNIRWVLVGLIAIVVAALGGFGYWLFERPAAQQAATVTKVETSALALFESMPELQELKKGLLTPEMLVDPTAISALDLKARALFEASGGLAPAQADLRRAASQAAGSALDGIRLINQALSYRAAVTPTLSTPDLEVDPTLIELDDAARFFGDWQLRFDQTRTALPDDVMSGVTERLDSLSRDLGGLLTSYVDALRTDDKQAVESVVAELGARLDQIKDSMSLAMEDIQARIAIRIDETRVALDKILEG